MNTVDALIGLDEGTLSEDEETELFRELVDSGLAWKLQGRIGRQAMDMIDAGLVTP